MHLKNNDSLVVGIIFVAIGLFFGIHSLSYPIGTSSDMGPGYFPLLCSGLLLLIGLGISTAALTARGGEEGATKARFAYKPLIIVTLADVLFAVGLSGVPALGIPALGFIVSSGLAVGVSLFAAGAPRFKELVAMVLLLAIGSWLVFGYALNLPFSAWPSLAG